MGENLECSDINSMQLEQGGQGERRSEKRVGKSMCHVSLCRDFNFHSKLEIFWVIFELRSDII